MKGAFLYPNGKGACAPNPHPCFLAWAKSAGCKVIETPMGFGKMKKPIPKGCDFLLFESLYCLPYVASYKNDNPDCKIISIIADTSFLPEKLSLARRLYYWAFIRWVDVFIVQSQRIRSDALVYGIRKPIYVLRSFIANKCEPKRNKEYCNGLLFIGNAVKEKGSMNAIRAMEFLPDFRLAMVGSCMRKGMHSVGRENIINIFSFGWVDSLKPYFDDSTFYIHPSGFDPCPSTVWEAMYAGLLPIITKDVGQAELFDGKLEVLMLDNNDPRVIAEKVKQIHSLSKRKKDELRKLCKQLVLKYTEKRSVKEFKEILKCILENGNL